ncbi:MAG: carboxypeptidase-like regulatory domain-containing protein [Acidobacteriota bacterium]|nr:carboxypeptidase-like regulatory domain-containing protein [Acidobacteriota bacterium]
MKQHLLVVGVVALFATAGALAQVPGGGQGPLRGQARATPLRDDAPRGTAVIRGQIVAADTGAPIRRAQVRVSSPEARESRVAATDAQGRFEVKELPAGRYTINASKGGFVTLQYGQRRPSESGTPIELGDGQTLDKLTIALPRGSVLGGRITDEFGEPVANASVIAMRYSYAGGGRRLTAAPGSNSRDTTDDQGHYRLFGLPPGEYFVSATLRSGPEAADPTGEVSGYAATYFPGTPNLSEAARVTLAVSQENTTVSFGLIATRLVRVSGQVLTSTGEPAAGGNVMLLSGGSATGRGIQLQQGGGGGGRIDRTGAFTIANVAPGRYQVQARSGGRGGDGELAKMDLVVGTEDVGGVTLVTAPGAIVTGLVVSDTGEPFDFPTQQLQVGARAANPDAPGAGGGISRVGANFTFELRGLTDARLFRVSAPQGWTLKSVALGGQDITDVPTELPPGQSVAGMQIVLTKKTTTLSGVVSDAAGRPLLDATVVVFPANQQLWTFQSRFIKAARPDQDGTYRVAGLPASEDYLIVAVQGLEDGQAGDPEFLAAVKEAAAKFALADGETKAVDVKLSAPK